jgi:hypothetical protein
MLWTCCGSQAAPVVTEKDTLSNDDETSLVRRCTQARLIAQLSVPGLVLALLPKCPLCLAAYITAGTGISLSTSGAGCLRTAVVCACVAALMFLTAQLLWKVSHAQRQRHETA